MIIFEVGRCSINGKERGTWGELQWERDLSSAGERGGVDGEVGERGGRDRVKKREV